MEEKRRDCKGSDMESSEAEEMELRRGPWAMDEDIKLMNYIAHHGDGRWNSLARCAGLKRTGKSCRLRWLNYLRPGVRRGNITVEEQLLILELHSRWGSRWSKIAQHLPGRTDNEIKNYWRTRVQKHAKQLKCDVNSKLFKDTIRNLWMPRLIEKHLQAQSKSQISSNTFDNSKLHPSSCTSESFGTQFSPISDQTEICTVPVKDGNISEIYSIQNDYFPASDNLHQGYFQKSCENIGFDFPFGSSSSFSCLNQGLDFQPVQQNNPSFEFAEANLDSLWSDDDSWYAFSQEQINDIL